MIFLAIDSVLHRIYRKSLKINDKLQKEKKELRTWKLKLKKKSKFYLNILNPFLFLLKMSHLLHKDTKSLILN